MNYGRFFLLDSENSNLEKGIAIFDYAWIKHRGHDRDTPLYPFYLVISREAVNFYSHYYIEDSPTDGKRHLHNRILTLPLSDNLEVKDSLTNALMECFDTPYPVDDTLPAETFGGRDVSLFNHQFNLVYDKLKKLIRDGGESPGSEHDNRIRFELEEPAYWNLPVFRLTDALRADRINEHRTEFRYFIRKLVLDFLFDLEHSNVFENSPFYEHLKLRLRENLFLRALINKAEFYYRYRLLESEVKAKAVEKKHDRNSETDLVFYSNTDAYIVAEEQWCECLRNPDFDKYFILRHFDSNSWFRKPEKEMNEIYILKARLKKLDGQMFRVGKCRWRKIGAVISKITQAGKKSRKKTFRQILDDFHVKQPRTKVLKRNSKLNSKWYLRKYDLFHSAPSALSFVSYISLFVIFFGYACLHFYSPEAAKDNFSYFAVLFGCSTVLLVVSCGKSSKRGIHLFLPRLLAAIITVWITLCFTEDLFKAFFDTRVSWQLCLVLSFVTTVFVINEVGRAVPYLTLLKKFVRAFFQLLPIAFLYAFTVGFVITGLTAGSFMERNDGVKRFYNNTIFSPDGIDWSLMEGYEKFLISNAYNQKYFGSNSMDKQYTDRLVKLIQRDMNITNESLSPLSAQPDGIWDYDRLLSRVSLSEFDSWVVEGSGYRPEKTFYRYVAWDDKQRRAYTGRLLSGECDLGGDIRLEAALVRADNDILYRNSLEWLRLEDSRFPVLSTFSLSKRVTFFILPGFLIQFSVLVMFLGIFIQLIFEQKKITD